MSDPSNFDEWSKLLHWFSRRVWRRSIKAGAQVPYEDIFAESCIAWCIARDSFDPNRGVEFSAYLIYGAKLHINRWLQRQIDAGYRSQREISLDASVENARHSRTASLGNRPISDLIADENAVNAERELERRKRLEAFAARLSPRARQYLTLLANPPEEILAISRAIDARNDRARACGYARFAFKNIYSRIIFDLMGAGQVERKRITDQIEARLGARQKDAVHDRQ